MCGLFAATLYGEGLRRAYGAIAGVDDHLVGFRGRLAVVPLLVLAPLLLPAVLGLTPVLNQLSSHGTGSTVLGLYLALNVNWMVLSLPLAWSYRIVAPDPPSWKVAMAGGADADAQDVGGRNAGRPDADPARAGSSRVVGGGV